MRIIIAYLFISIYMACNVLPKNYDQYIIGTWENEEHIQTIAGTNKILYSMTLSKDTSFSLTETHPILGTTIVNYTYIVGYYPPKPALMLLDPITLESLQQPIFFMLSNNNSILITSSNANLALKKVWTRKG